LKNNILHSFYSSLLNTNLNQYIAKPDPFPAEDGGAEMHTTVEKQRGVSLLLFKLSFRQNVNFCVGFELTTPAATARKNSGAHRHCDQGHGDEHQYFSHSKYLQLGINAAGIRRQL
jgi:hypothetical protein